MGRLWTLPLGGLPAMLVLRERGLYARGDSSTGLMDLSPRPLLDTPAGGSKMGEGTRDGLAE